MRKIKVFYMVYSLTSGGIERYSIDLFRYLRNYLFEIDFITKLDRKEFFDDTLKALGGKKIPIAAGCKGKGAVYKINYIFNTLKIANSTYDIAYFNLSKPMDVFKYPLICRLRGIKKIIIHSHNSSSDNTGIVAKILNLLGRIVINHIATVKFACSDKAAIWMYGKKSKVNNDYIFIKNGIEASKFVFDPIKREKVKDDLGIKENTFVIGHVGRFAAQKNHKFIIDIFEGVLKVKQDVILLLAGVGELQNEIIEYSKKKGIFNHIKFLGEIENVHLLFQALDVFILPSLYEGLPVVGIEAQASGLKCLFSDTITTEVDVTGNVKFIPLQEKEWISEILSMKDYPRNNMLHLIEDSGFDMKNTSEIVAEILKNIV